MLKRTSEVVRAVAEQAGLLNPSVPDALVAAETHRHALVTAQTELEASTAALHAAYDRGAEEPEILRLEAKQAAAKQTVSRAEERYRAAERRLAKAEKDAKSQRMESARLRLAEALAVRTNAAIQIDRLAGDMAAQVRRISEQDAVIAEGMRDGVAAEGSYFVFQRGQRAAELALSRAGAIPRAYGGDLTQHPGAQEVIGSDNDAILAHAS